MTPWPRGSRAPRAGRAPCARRCRAAASLLGAVAHGLAVLVGRPRAGPMSPLASILDQAGLRARRVPAPAGRRAGPAGRRPAGGVAALAPADQAAGPGGPGPARGPCGHRPRAGQGRPGALADQAAGRRPAGRHHRGGHLRRPVPAGPAVPERVAQPGRAVPAQAGGGRRAAAGRRRGGGAGGRAAGPPRPRDGPGAADRPRGPDHGVRGVRHHGRRAGGRVHRAAHGAGGHPAGRAPRPPWRWPSASAASTWPASSAPAATSATCTARARRSASTRYAGRSCGWRAPPWCCAPADGDAVRVPNHALLSARVTLHDEPS